MFLEEMFKILQGDDSRGIVVASWGAVLSYGAQRHFAVNQSVIAAMRVLFGLDTDIPVTADRAPIPVARWEISRLKLRSFIDCSINGISSVAAIHKLVSQIDNIVINEEVFRSLLSILIYLKAA